MKLTKEEKAKVKQVLENELNSEVLSLDEHFTKYGWNLDARMIVSDILLNTIGINPIDYLLMNTLNITKDSKVPLIVKFDENERIMFCPYKHGKVYYNYVSNKIVLIKPKRLNKKKTLVFSFTLSFDLPLENHIYLGDL